MSEAIRVNFGKPMPIFPLPDAVLLPHALQPLHIFEPRYRQMVADALDGPGQIAMASFQANGRKAGEVPSLRPAVCVGQIVQHQTIDEERFNILLQGVCRARILRLLEPEEGRPYRMARLAPLERLGDEPPQMPGVRATLRRLLSRPGLSRFRAVETVVKWFDRKDVSTHALLELIGFALVGDAEGRYQLLEEADPFRRANMIRRALTSLDSMVRKADGQPWRSWPKGVSWN